MNLPSLSSPLFVSEVQRSNPGPLHEFFLYFYKGHLSQGLGNAVLGGRGGGRLVMCVLGSGLRVGKALSSGTGEEASQLWLCTAVMRNQ